MGDGPYELIRMCKVEAHSAERDSGEEAPTKALVQVEALHILVARGLVGQTRSR